MPSAAASSWVPSCRFHRRRLRAGLSLKQQCRADVTGGQQRTFSHADLVVVLVQNVQVKGEQREDDADEGEPDPDGLAQKVGDKKRGQLVDRPASRDCGGCGADAEQITDLAQLDHVSFSLSMCHA